MIEVLNRPLVLKGKRIEGLVGFADEKRRAVEALESGRSVFITGDCGTGKSHLAYGLLYHWFKVNEFLTGTEIREMAYPSDARFQKRARFLPAVELFHELRKSYHDDSEGSEDDIVRAYTVDDLLILDDIGAEKVSEWSRSIFYLLIDRRYRDCRQTIYTSNLSMKQISDVVDDRVASRLATCEVIELKGSDWRVSHGE